MIDESYQEDSSKRIVYAPNGDMVDWEDINIDDEPTDTNEIYMVVEDSPQFPGGLQALLDYLHDNIKYPESCRRDSIQGRVIISFVVEKDGSISGVKITKSLSPECDKEALRVLNMMPHWQPGVYHDQPCRTKVCIPIVFKL